MAENGEPKNWVEREHARERALEANIPALWTELFGAVTGAVTSFRALYGDSEPVRVHLGPEDSTRGALTVRVTRAADRELLHRGFHDRQTVLTLKLMPDEPAVRVDINDFKEQLPKPSATAMKFPIVADEHGRVWFTNAASQTRSVDEISRDLLKDLLLTKRTMPLQDQVS